MTQESRHDSRIARPPAERRATVYRPRRPALAGR
jgi:hypothetical protein